MSYAAFATKNKMNQQPVNMVKLERDVLPHVFKPGRYMGLEQGAYNKPFHKAKATLAFAFPDLYEIGISNYGIKLMYSVVNQHPDYLCDRVYAAAQDMRDKLAETNIPLYGVESKMPLAAFDILAFSLQYELNYTTILGVLETAQIPFRAADREDGDYPILIAGGPGSGNPMSLAPFFDAFILGDGEEVLIEILDVISAAKEEGLNRQETLDKLRDVEGMYFPGQTEVAYKRIVEIAEQDVDIAPLVPAVASVFDRVVVEARRGCDRMCRFCQPCFMNLPTREQSIETIKKNALQELEKTGYEECSLLSLSIADYSHFKPLIMDVSESLKERGASLSLSSQRADRFSVEVAEAVQSVKKSTLTFAPEAGTPRMRDVINKNLSDEEILNAVTSAYKAGWNKVKLYFMIGLPTETTADLDGIVDIVKRMQAACREIKREAGKSMKNHLDVNVTISNFVPKPHTPFQWHPQDSMPMLREKIDYLKTQFKPIRGAKINFTDPEISKLEAVISKGGPELAEVLEKAYHDGAYLDAWDDISNFQVWFKALHALGYDEEVYTRERLTELEEALPWDLVHMGLDKDWLKEEYRRSVVATSTTPCFETCSTCGVCATYSTWPSFIETPSKPKTLKIVQETRAEHLGKPPVGKVRLQVEKREGLRFISHLDWLRIIHRALKRAGVPVAYSQGFSPKPRTTFTSALPLFMESRSEYIDVDLIDMVDGVKDALNKYLPKGGKVLSETYLDTQAPRVNKKITHVVYTAQRTGGGTCQNGEKPVKIEEAIRSFVNASEIWVDAPTKNEPQPLDLKPYLYDVSKLNSHSVQITFTVRPENPEIPAKDLGSLKPDWVLSKLDSTAAWRVERSDIQLKAD